MELNTPVSHLLREAKEFMAETPQMVLLKPRHGIMALPLGSVSPATTGAASNNASAMGNSVSLLSNNNVSGGANAMSANGLHPTFSSGAFGPAGGDPNAASTNKSPDRVSPFENKSFTGIPAGPCPFGNPQLFKMVPVHQSASGGGSTACGTSPRPSPPNAGSSGPLSARYATAATTSAAAAAGGGGGPSASPVRTVSQIKLGVLSPAANNNNNNNNNSKSPIPSVGNTPRRHPSLHNSACGQAATGAGEVLKFPPISPRREVVS